MIWQLGDRVTAPYLGNGIVAKINPCIVHCRGGVIVRGSQSALEAIGWVLKN